MTIEHFPSRSPLQTAQSPYKKTYNLESFDEISMACLKVYELLQENKIDAVAAVNNLLTIAEENSWKVPDKLFRNLNVYLLSVFDLYGANPFSQLIDKIYQKIHFSVVPLETLQLGVLKPELFEHIFNKSSYGFMSEGTKNQIKELIYLSPNFTDYAPLKVYEPSKSFTDIINAFAKYQFDIVSKLVDKKISKTYTIDSFSISNSISNFSRYYGIRLRNVMTQLLRDDSGALDECVNAVYSILENSQKCEICKSLITLVKNNKECDIEHSIRHYLLKQSKSSQNSYATQLFLNELQVQFLQAKKSQPIVLEKLLSFLEFHEEKLSAFNTLAHYAFAPDFLNENTDITKVSHNCKVSLHGLLVNSEAPLPTLDQIPNVNLEKRSFYHLAMNVCTTIQVKRLIIWGVFLFDSPSAWCMLIESLDYTSWYSCLKSYLGSMEKQYNENIVEGFDFIGVVNKDLLSKRVLKADIDFTVLLHLIRYTSQNFVFGSSGGGNVNTSSNLRRLLERIDSDSPYVFEMIFKSKISEVINYLKNPVKGDSSFEIDNLCFLLQLALGFENEYVDEDISECFVESISQIQNSQEREAVITNLFLVLSPESITKLGIFFRDEKFCFKVKCELTCRLHANFLNIIWGKLRSSNDSLCMKIFLQLKESDRAWWNILFLGSPLESRMMTLVQQLSGEFNDESASVIYHYLSPLIDEYADSDSQEQLAKLFNSQLISQSKQSSNRQDFISKVFVNLLNCLEERNWNDYHNKIKIFDVPSYILSVLSDRPLNKSFIDFIIKEFYKNANAYPQFFQEIHSIIQSSKNWYDQFFDTHSFEDRLENLFQICILEMDLYSIKAGVREFINLITSCKTVFDIQFTLEKFANLLNSENKEDQAQILMNIFELLSENNLTHFFQYNSEGLKAFKLFLEEQISTNNGHFITYLFRWIEENQDKINLPESCRVNLRQIYSDKWCKLLMTCRSVVA